MFSHAFSRMAARRVAATTAARRFKSTAPNNLHYSNRDASFKKTWLMDAGAYPIMVILSFAVTMCVSFTALKGTTNPDVRGTPSKRNALLRYWE